MRRSTATDAEILADYDPRTGGNFAELAAKYGFSLVDIHKFIHARRPDLYAAYLRSLARIRINAQESDPAFDAQPQNIFASRDHLHNHRRTASPSYTGRNWGKLKKNRMSADFCHVAANSSPVPQTHCTVRIGADRSVLVDLSDIPANGLALELRFASDVRNADIHRSCPV